MEGQKQDASRPLYVGAVQNAKEVNINGGNFAIHHNTTERESITDINIKKLYEHISTAALHNSRERVQEISETELKNIVHEWSSRLRALPMTILNPPESSPLLGSPFDRLSTDDALYDILKWLYDPFTSYSVVWMHGDTRAQALLLANALAHVLHQHRLLSASYFFSAATDSASVVPTIAYQLARNITQAAVPIARAVSQNLAVFTSSCYDQVEQLIVNPLRHASDSLNEFVEAPKVIVIHGLEDYNSNDKFQTSFLDSLTRAVVSLEITPFPQKLLVLGQYTDQLQDCFSTLASQLKMVHRPMQLHNLLGKEHDICRKEKEIEKRDKALTNKEKTINARVEALRRELRSQEAHLNRTKENLKQMEKDLKKQEGALRYREEGIVSQEQVLKKKREEMEDTTRRREEALGLREQAAAEREGALRGREEDIANQEQDLKKRQEMRDATRGREAALELREQAVRECEQALERKQERLQTYGTTVAGNLTPLPQIDDAFELTSGDGKYKYAEIQAHPRAIALENTLAPTHVEKEKKRGFWYSRSKGGEKERNSERAQQHAREKEIQLMKERQEREQHDKRGKEPLRREDEHEPEELTRMIVYLTATAAQDWPLLLEVSERASATEASAREAIRTLRREFKYGEPAEQLSAAKVWAVMLRNSSGVFPSESQSRKFLDTVEELLTSPRTSPVVRERLLEVVAAAAYASKPEKDGRNNSQGFQNLWKRVKPFDKPEEGVPFDPGDPIFQPPLLAPLSARESPVSATPLPIKSAPPRPKRESPLNRIIPQDEDTCRLFQECKIGQGNASILLDALLRAKPEDLEKVDVIKVFHAKCRASQELIYAQIPWATSMAERSRANKQPDIAERRASVDITSPVELTTEEKLLEALLVANEELLQALKQWDDLHR